MASPLSAVFLARNPGGSASGLEERLQALVRAGRAAWPQLAALEDAAFVTHLAERVSATEPLEDVEAADLWLACACARGLTLALALFEEHLLPKVTVTIARVDASPAFADDVRQALRQKLFVQGRIADYSGQGPLVSWLRAAAVRTALNQGRPQRRDEALEDDVLEALPAAVPDPELALLHAQHRQAFRAAFAQALRALSTRERMALKLQAIDGLTLERIGEIYGTHKSTVSRWLSHAHEVLLERTRAHLAQALSLESRELESVMRGLRSQLDVSLARLLGTDVPGGG